MIACVSPLWQVFAAYADGITAGTAIAAATSTPEKSFRKVAPFA
jgi:hypothetical protein